MNTLDAIKSRRSIRRYDPDAGVPREHITQLLEAAMMAPSACNTRPWEFVVVESREVKEKIMKAMPYAQMLATAPLAIIICGIRQGPMDADIQYCIARGNQLRL